jgi:hypothetical protein
MARPDPERKLEHEHDIEDWIADLERIEEE